MQIAIKRFWRGQHQPSGTIGLRIAQGIGDVEHGDAHDPFPVRFRLSVAGDASPQGLQRLAQMAEPLRPRRRPQIPQDRVELPVAIAHDRGIHPWPVVCAPPG
jgi:hypothetical protein